MSSHFERAIEIMAKVHDGGPIEEDYGRSVTVRIVGGTEDWTDEQSDELWQIIDRAGSLDDSAPEDGHWVFSLSSRDADAMLEQLKSRLPAISRHCQIVIEEYLAQEDRTIVHWRRS